MRSVWMMYHDVYMTKPRAGVPRSASRYHIPMERYREHLEAIYTSGRRVVTVGEFLRSRPEDSVVLTFDDGWRGAFEVALPLLNLFGWKATFFVTRNFIGREGFCDRRMLCAAARHGMELGVHGTTHRMLSACTRAQITSELGDCKWYLESVVDGPVESASLPGGDLTSEIVACAGEIGLRSLCTSRPGINRDTTSVFDLKRISIRATTTATDIRRYCEYRIGRDVARWAILQAPRMLLGMRNYSLLRRRILGERTGSANEIFQP